MFSTSNFGREIAVQLFFSSKPSGFGTRAGDKSQARCSWRHTARTSPPPIESRKSLVDGTHQLEGVLPGHVTIEADAVDEQPRHSVTGADWPHVVAWDGLPAGNCAMPPFPAGFSGISIPPLSRRPSPGPISSTTIFSYVSLYYCV